MKPDLSTISRAPDGVAYPVPNAAQVAAQFTDIQRAVEGRPVVAVQGLGFVGSAVAAAIADARDAAGAPRWNVIGVDLATPGSWWKISRINEGRAPIGSPDAEFERLVQRGIETGNLFATASDDAYTLAEVIVIDVHLDVIDRRVQEPSDIQLDLAGFERAVRAVGRKMRPDALVLVETTVPIGACEKVVRPALEAERRARGITEPVALAHAYERVMPGPRYIDSIRRFWRSFSATDEATAARAREFLGTFIDTVAFPPAELAEPNSSEMAKVLENSYRAANIAFIHEWTLLAERAGINLWAVVDSIRVRKGTHDNMRYPGFGVGGYCLTKDSLLAQWSATHLFKTDQVLGVTLEALRINHDMPLHTLDLVRELAGGSLSGLRILVCGISYLPDVADTRNSPTEIFVDRAEEEGAQVLVHDPCLSEWLERPKARLVTDLPAVLTQVDAVVLAVPHAAYRKFSAADFPSSLQIVDANNVISDALADSLHAAGARLAGVGKGHWRKRGYHLPK